MMIFARKLGRSLDFRHRFISSSHNDFCPRDCESKNQQGFYKGQYFNAQNNPPSPHQSASSQSTEAIDAYFASWNEFRQPELDSKLSNTMVISKAVKSRHNCVTPPESPCQISITKLQNRKGMSEVIGPQSSQSDKVIVNPCGIQMLSDTIHQQIFKNTTSRNHVSDQTLVKVKKHLNSHNLWGRSAQPLPNVNLTLPPLEGDGLLEHFQNIAEKQCKIYRESIEAFIAHEVPDMPIDWKFAPGWTCYNAAGQAKQVDYPDEDAYVFDVEVCVKEGHLPTIATAVSSNHWYSWCSPQLFEHKTAKTALSGLDPYYTPNRLINLECGPLEEQLPLNRQKERVVIGHNVSYDRARVKEQYFIEGTKLRFLDTMAMHIAVSGITSYQRNILAADKSTKFEATEKVDSSKRKSRFDAYHKEEVMDWKDVSSMNGLNDVHKLYCGGLDLDKEKRNIFVTGSLSDIKEDFQNLVTYCANDTLATYRILTKLFPEYLSRFPHPVTLAGVLEMSTAYLPVNRNWQRYLRDCEDAYGDVERDLTQQLKKEADRSCHLLENELYKRDPWLWDLDWSSQPLKMKKAKAVSSRKSRKATPDNQPAEQMQEKPTEPSEEQELDDQFRSLMNSRERLFKRATFLPGYPAWYRSLCDKHQDGLDGPKEITTSNQAVPKLLKLTWDGYPLFHSRSLGWGYLVPGRPLDLCARGLYQTGDFFPLKVALEEFPPRDVEVVERTKGMITAQEAVQQLAIDLERCQEEVAGDQVLPSEKLKAGKLMHRSTADHPAWHQGIGPYDVGVAGCWFFRLPHKSGVDNNVGNPLAKDYLNRIEDGTLQTATRSIAKHVLELNRMMIYWRNARDRILSQMVVWLKESQLPAYVRRSDQFDPSGSYGAILPQVITTGTLTRRAVESTWLTASNAYSDRLGSELKAMIQCPPGLSMVGADVDSQELWIASIIGDAHFAGLHGSTAFGWMTLQGKKSDGTDMHSRTASTISISRDQAKVINYGRIYGAGERFAKTLLMQFNNQMTEKEAAEKARQMYAMTKGTSAYELSELGRYFVETLGEDPNQLYSSEDLSRLRRKARASEELYDLSKKTTEQLTVKRKWVNGTESNMFNKLEEIAQSPSPKTPVLGCKISRALEPQNVGRDFMTSRVNWVVQSSAVDYLHLMLVAMRHLFQAYKIDGRFCISIHDEVRYIVDTEDRFRAALALQITNLWTRSLFAHQLGMDDLPQAVAFFSSVDIDTVLRKETNMDCQTPSNPYGLKQGYGIPFGQSYDIYQILEETKGSLDR